MLPVPLVRLVGRGSRRPHRRNGIHELNPRNVGRALPLVVTSDVLAAIRRTVGAVPAESGGVLGGWRASGVVSAFIPDRCADVTSSTYTPDTAFVNRVIREQWKPNGMEFMGFVHSHPNGFLRPSAGDAAYAGRILEALGWLDAMAMPIVGSAADSGGFSLNAFHALRCSGYRPSEVISGPLVVESSDPQKANPYLDRVHLAYDESVMKTTRIVAIGTGGSASYLEDMARSGIGEFVLVDPDVVEPANIGTQHTWPGAIGEPKVTSLAERLLALNPLAQVWTVLARDDELNDLAFRVLVRAPLPGGPDRAPRATLLCAFTDSFEAQARLSRLALQLAVPFLAAAVYREGRGVEVVFSSPGVTPACARCAQASRYQAYLSEGFVNSVTSHGTPILATSRLNALKQVVTLALLHGTSPSADPGHPATGRYAGTLRAIAGSNLVLTRLDKDIENTLSLRAFSAATATSAGRLILDDTQWLRQLPDRPDNGFPQCPDCGGTGNLWDARGAFRDTRVMPRVFGDGRWDDPAVSASAQRAETTAGAP